MFKRITIGATIGMAGAGIAAVFAFKKVRDLEKKIKIAVDSTSDKIDVEVEDYIIQKATEKAVERAIEKEAKIAAAEVRNDLSQSINREVRTAVNDSYNAIRSDVKIKLEKEVGKVNISGIREEIIREGKRQATNELGDALKSMKESAEEEFKEKIEGITESYEENIKALNSIYNKIASCIPKSNDKPENSIILKL